MVVAVCWVVTNGVVRLIIGKSMVDLTGGLDCAILKLRYTMFDLRARFEREAVFHRAKATECSMKFSALSQLKAESGEFGCTDEWMSMIDKEMDFLLRECDRHTMNIAVAEIAIERIDEDQNLCDMNDIEQVGTVKVEDDSVVVTICNCAKCENRR